MRFLVNMNLPPSLARRLTEAGHPSRHARTAGLARAEDTRILDEASATGEIVLTHDLDYARLLASRGATAPSVIIYRLRRIDTDRLWSLLMAALPRVFAAIQAGAIVMIEEESIRTHRLPVIEE